MLGLCQNGPNGSSGSKPRNGAPIAAAADRATPVTITLAPVLTLSFIASLSIFFCVFVNLSIIVFSSQT